MEAEVMTASGTPAMPYVLLEMDGEVGGRHTTLHARPSLRNVDRLGKRLQHITPDLRQHIRLDCASRPFEEHTQYSGI
eukprot:1718295-Amphidinium_carterae.1